MAAGENPLTTESEANKAYKSSLAAFIAEWSAANEMVVPFEFDAAIEEKAIRGLLTEMRADLASYKKKKADVATVGTVTAAEIEAYRLYKVYE